MELTTEEFKVLCAIEEGMSSPEGIYVQTGFGDVKEILLRLEELGFIELKKKFDTYYKKDFWDAKLTEKGEELLKEY